MVVEIVVVAVVVVVVAVKSVATLLVPEALEIVPRSVSKKHYHHRNSRQTATLRK
jgi:hypothetical protein